MAHFEKDLSREDIFKGKIFDIARHTVELENGETTLRDIVYHNGGCCVVAIDDDGNLLMVKQFRFPTGQELYELPAGKLEKGENPTAAAMRELEEETGYRTDSLSLLSVFYPTPAYCSEQIYLFMADKLIESTQHLDDGEFLSIEKIPFADAVQMVLNNEIVDAKTQTGILMADRIYNK